MNNATAAYTNGFTDAVSKAIELGFITLDQAKELFKHANKGE